MFKWKKVEIKEPVPREEFCLDPSPVSQSSLLSHQTRVTQAWADCGICFQQHPEEYFWSPSRENLKTVLRGEPYQSTTKNVHY